MNQKKPKGSKKLHAPKSKPGKVLLNLVITAVIGFVYFYFTLPALNPQSADFYAFVGLLCVVYIVCAFITGGFHLEGPSVTVTSAGVTVTKTSNGKVRDYFHFIKKQCLPIGILLAVLIVAAVVGQIISLPIFRAASYRELLDVQEGSFSEDVKEISFSEIPMLDEDSARYLSTTQMGTIPDMASQFEVAYDSTQINYQGRPVRVAPLEYADIIKWFTNRAEGLPAYIVVDMVTQEVQVVRLPEGQGMKYSPSEPLNRNVYRHLRFNYPTYMFATPSFEIDEDGNPWWICPRVVKTIGLFGGTDIKGAVLMNAVTGACEYYEEVPSWVDRVYLASLIMEQYDYYGTLVHGFLNSIFGQKDVRVTTEGYNYIAINDDVYMYTGVTSATSDQSNLGFLLCNQRTKETKFYTVPGATEQSARASAEGMVQDQGYRSTFPLLLNVADQPTYFIALKDNRQLVKQYAMVNVGQFTVVGIGDTVASCEQNYLEQMAAKGITIDQENRVETQVTGVVEDIRSAVIDGNTYYYLRLEGEDVYYSISARDNAAAVILNPGDRVTINHAPVAEGDAPDIVEGYTLALR